MGRKYNSQALASEHKRCVGSSPRSLFHYYANCVLEGPMLLHGLYTSNRQLIKHSDVSSQAEMKRLAYYLGFHCTLQFHIDCQTPNIKDLWFVKGLHLVNDSWKFRQNINSEVTSLWVLNFFLKSVWSFDPKILTQYNVNRFEAGWTQSYAEIRIISM